MGTVSVSVPGTSNADAVAYFSPAFSSVPRIVVFTIFREDSATSQNLSTGYLVAKTASYFIAR